MLSRRALLMTVAVTAGLRSFSARATPLNGGKGSPLHWVATSGRCRDMRCFRRALDDDLNCVNGGADEFIEDLAGVLAASNTNRVAGLSQDSDFVLITQLAMERGFSLCYMGSHLYREGVLEHRLEARGDAADRLRRTLLASGRDWAASLAEGLRAIAVSQGAVRATRFEVPGQRPVDSPGYLVSWTFRRVGR